ncbi:hypothetical protein EAG_02230 [Camponotus floridanus]|uniref:Uncharacterized protein n=1 Tax=Camponotus floridanus TaxID=104421 RepID=E2AD06_CAMFO|nr:hypothetical protein EAG_02230 [Camponotus floridanus]
MTLKIMTWANRRSLRNTQFVKVSISRWVGGGSSPAHHRAWDDAGGPVATVLCIMHGINLEKVIYVNQIACLIIGIRYRDYDLKWFVWDFSKRSRDPFAARYSSCVQSILDTTEIALSRDLANRNRAVSVRRRNFMSSRGERKQKRRNISLDSPVAQPSWRALWGHGNSYPGDNATMQYLSIAAPQRCGEEEDEEDWPIACNLRPLKTRWETAWLLCLNGTGDGVCGAGKNVEGSNGGWTRNVHVPPDEGEVLAL